MSQTTQQDLPLVAIVGRPNVGKSALFNAIVGRRVSIVHEQSGVTRDRIMAPVSRFGRPFLLVDTGGLGVLVKEKKVEMFDGLVRDQVLTVVAEATVIIWVVDCQAGVTPLDTEVAAFLRQSGARVVVAANKADNETLRQTAVAEFAPLGFTDIIPTCCTHSAGIRELVLRYSRELPTVPEPPDDAPGLKLAVIGRPNVGKSSIVNRLLGQDRVIVSDIPGTTRDAIDVPFVLKSGDEEVRLTLIDTAGLRQRRRVDSVVEFFSITRAERAIGRCDCVLLVLDATMVGSAQDRRIAHLVVEERKPCIIAVNKWDLVKHGMRVNEMQNLVRQLVPFLHYAPIECVSALAGENMPAIFERLLEVRRQAQVMIPTAVLNRFIQDTTARTPPSAYGSKVPKIYYGTMTGNPPPRIVLFVNAKKAFAPNYLQFLENQLRNAFFPRAGLTVWLELRESRGPEPTGEGRPEIARSGPDLGKLAPKARRKASAESRKPARPERGGKLRTRAAGPRRAGSRSGGGRSGGPRSGGRRGRR
ncbi:MAG: ribosome biogenesis GTPase Der [Lentisphaerae bacterium RIFOXYB12_FULL_65_16]|nr:MAG: ribosome biogenesis GTPase Der [Lentisphaerae bacterium RIFOXYA12_64_32]OGV86572.1 MAG: ribosome biogenesis GTPase Der [Lentisphaerae bacterium RIFOXYB12_FULL_65_16]